MFKSRAIILKSEDWEGLYIDKVLIEEFEKSKKEIEGEN